MSTYIETVEKKLSDLLQKTYDAEKGFKEAAENVKSQSLKSYFQLKAKERYDFGFQLKNELASYGKDIEKSGSFTGAAHRTWMDIKSLFSSNDEEAMLEEAIRGEKASLEEYKEVLKEFTLPESTTSILKSQKDRIQMGLDTIKTLENLH